MFNSVRDEGTELPLTSDNLSLEAKPVGIFYQDVMMDSLLLPNRMFFYKKSSS